MNSIESDLIHSVYAKSLREAVETACKHIAPTWPLDQFIAVNPYWGFIDAPIHVAASRIQSYCGSPMLMPRSFFRQQLKAGSFSRVHLQDALEASGLCASADELLAELDREPPVSPRIPLMTAMADAQHDLLHGMSICDFVTHNVSQHCASYFDYSQATWEPQREENLYRSWLRHASADRSPWLLMGIHHFRKFARTLPSDPMAMIEESLIALPVPPSQWTPYLTALLMSINGWASWCAYARWQAQLSNKEDDHIVQLLAIRIAWERFAFIHLLDSVVPATWTSAWNTLSAFRQDSAEHSSLDWIFQEALERSSQEPLCAALTRKLPHPNAAISSKPSVQAIFCIDVRSEVFRRALESCSDEIQTLGFAGFFGLPISFTPLGTSEARPQLPGLLAPKLQVSESTGSKHRDQEILEARQKSRSIKLAWKDFKSSASSTFTFVESCGLFYATALLRNTLLLPGSASEIADTKREKSHNLRPSLSSIQGKGKPSDESLCEMLAGILTNMSLTANFARLVVLIGHGSKSVNNPHAAGLDCGACGGQSGEVNAKLLAGLLNDEKLRAGLLNFGIALPSTTHFVAGLHNTTTEEVTLFDTDCLPRTHASDLARLQDCLRQAGHRARIERAQSVGIKGEETVSANDLLRQFQFRSRDWSQVRPEWGLANNSAFLIAPRSRSRGANLQGRVFLHEYRWDLDQDGNILEAIMTAPMLVTNWINMQYYASTVDNRMYGSGNKVLHNVVGGRLGVFEGNGGDLRIGLPLQSLHDGQTLRHTPLRLSVFIEAPQSAITKVVRKHRVVMNLVHNSWLHLFQIEPGKETISRYKKGGWEIVATSMVKACEDFEPSAEALPLQ